MAIGSSIPQWTSPGSPTQQVAPLKSTGTKPGGMALSGVNPGSNNSLMTGLSDSLKGMNAFSSTPIEGQVGPMSVFNMDAYDMGMNTPVEINMGDGTSFNAGTTNSLSKAAGGIPESSGWGDNLSNIASMGNTLVGAFNAWTNYNALEETKDQNAWLKDYGTTEFNNAAQVYNQDRTDFLARTERAKGLTSEEEARDYANKRMETESVASI